MTDNDFSPTAFARAVGVLDTSVARWMKGEVVPSLKSVIKVADYMDCSLDYLFCLTDKRTVFAKSNSEQTFSKRFNELYQKSELSKVKMAQICGVESPAIVKWIKYGQLPKPDTVYRLAQYFSCSMDYLVGRSNQK